MRFGDAIDSFFDGFGAAGLFVRLRRPGSPDTLFRQNEIDAEVAPPTPVKEELGHVAPNPATHAYSK